MEYNFQEVPIEEDYKKALKLGITKGNVDRRIRYGWSLKKAISTPVRRNGNEQKREMVVLAQKNGISETCFELRLKKGWSMKDSATIKPYYHSELKKIADENGINQKTYLQRVSRGIDPFVAATKPLDPRGRECEFTKIAKENGINILTFRSRVKRGWDKQRAATEPVKSVGLHAKKRIS